MKKQFVENLEEGDVVNDYFVATRKDLRDTQAGGKFLGMVFKDRTGEVGGVMWNNAVSVSNLFELGDIDGGIRYRRFDTRQSFCFQPLKGPKHLLAACIGFAHCLALVPRSQDMCSLQVNCSRQNVFVSFGPRRSCTGEQYHQD